MTTNSPNPVDGDVQALIGLCKIEIKRWKAASESNPNMRYMVALIETALASLTTKPVGTVSIAMDWNTHRNIATINMRPDLVLAEMKDGDAIYTTPPAQLLRPLELPQSFYGVVQDGKSVMLAADDGQWLNKTAVIEALRQQGYEVKND